jgi:hypothetical protein
MLPHWISSKTEQRMGKSEAEAIRQPGEVASDIPPAFRPKFLARERKESRQIGAERGCVRREKNTHESKTHPTDFAALMPGNISPVREFPRLNPFIGTKIPPSPSAINLHKAVK